MSVEAYIASLSDERRPIVERLRETIINALPPGFVETMQYGMISYVVPHTLYPKGYHCKPTSTT